MSKCYQLIGVPGSGKTTWVNKNQDLLSKCVYISTDKFVEAYAHEVGKTYTEVFDEIMLKAIDMMTKEVIQARTEGFDIVWDQTSTTVASRLKKFRMLPDYEHIAVVFKTPEESELKRRLKSRPGKVIPQRVIMQMIEHWEDPTLEEGFDEIWNV